MKVRRAAYFALLAQVRDLMPVDYVDIMYKKVPKSGLRAATMMNIISGRAPQKIEELKLMINVCLPDFEIPEEFNTPTLAA